MSATPEFERSVFINCPFDDEYAPILQAIAFCVTELGFVPRLAPENPDNSTSRLDRILELVRGSMFGIHDLSRVKSREAGEYARLNMPFELGIDYACARFGTGDQSRKTVLVLEENRFDYQKGLSDIAGWDIEAHQNDHLKAVRVVRLWLSKQTGAQAIGSSQIMADYADFQGWHWEREIAHGASEEDIQEYPTMEFIRAMQDWSELDKPLGNTTDSQ